MKRQASRRDQGQGSVNGGQRAEYGSWSAFVDEVLLEGIHAHYFIQTGCLPTAPAKLSGCDRPYGCTALNIYSLAPWKQSLSASDQGSHSPASGAVADDRPRS